MTHRDVLGVMLTEAERHVEASPYDSVVQRRWQATVDALRYALRVVEDVERIAGEWASYRADVCGLRGSQGALYEGSCIARESCAAELRDILREDNG